MAKEDVKWKFKQAKNYYPGRRGETINRIFVHCTQTNEETAPGVQNYFATTKVKASAHVVVDTDEARECVKWYDTAFGAKGGNQNGWHLELCGFAQWTRDEWLDPNKGLPVLQWGACVAAEAVNLFRFFNAPFDIRWLSASEIRSGHGFGFVTHKFHNDVTGLGNHWDPGHNFPLAIFLDMVRWWMPHVTNGGNHFN